MDIKKTGHTCETSPEACAQPYLLPDTTLALFWMGRGAAILSSAQMTAEDLVFAVRGLGEAQAAYLQKLIEVCGACDALCECRAARVEETDALRRLPPKLLRELRDELDLSYLFISHDLSVMRFICDRIAVIHKGVIVELADTEELFAHPLHPYTRALLSAIPQPDPKMEKTKTLEIYDPSIHHYETDKPSWVEIRQQHYIFCNQQELEYYRKKLQTQ